VILDGPDQEPAQCYYTGRGHCGDCDRKCFTAASNAWPPPTTPPVAWLKGSLAGIPPVMDSRCPPDTLYGTSTHDLFPVGPTNPNWRPR
jgi:hypothetical protein